jgi:hypothetical protein
VLNVRLDVTFTLAGLLMTRSTAAGGYGVDAPLARDAQGRYCVPGTLVKGRLRDAWRELHAAAGDAFAPDEALLLGRRAGNADHDGPVDPARGRLRFGDFVCPARADAGTLFRIQIDAARGSVAHGAYQVIEAPFGAGETVTFHGAIRFTARDDGETAQVEHEVTTGLRWITSLGAMRTVGFGRVLAVDVQAHPELPASITATATGAACLPLLLTFDGPLCVPLRRIDDNLFESDDVVPGGVLKGSLATTWQALLGRPGGAAVDAATDPARPKLGEHFARLRITHAFPVAHGHDAPVRRPVAPPLSVVRAAGGVFDIALESGPVLIDGEAPAFAIDWKPRERDDVDRRFGWHRPRRELRVRTAVDPDTRRAAEGALFGYEMLLPEGCAWHARLDLDGVPEEDRLQVERELREVLSLGLHGIGKTKASARVEWLDPGADSDHVTGRSVEAGPWIVTLQAAALLCDPTGLLESSGERELRARYADAFAALSGGALRLTRYLARQRLAGGYYLHRRFQPGAPYRPYLLTEPGSVFVLEAAGPDHVEAARQQLERWRRHGLPLPPWLGGATWRTCPYVPENGYGEVAVNLDTHWSDRPVGRTRALAILGAD